MLWFFIDQCKATVALESWSNIKIIATMEVSIFVIAWFVVDDDFASHESYWCGIVFEGAIEVFPRGHCRIESSLSQQVEGEFGLGQELVP